MAGVAGSHDMASVRFIAEMRLASSLADTLDAAVAELTALMMQHKTADLLSAQAIGLLRVVGVGVF